MLTGADPDTHIAGRIISVDPLVTISSTNTAAPLGLVSVAPDLFSGRTGLHLLHHTWTLEQGDSQVIAAAIRNARAELPQSQFVMLAPSDVEALDFQHFGEAVIIGNGLIFTDERLWQPVRPTSDERFDAVYVARLDPMKRHELAAGIERLQLVYGYELSGGGGLERVRALLPRARLANHHAGGGEYAYLDQPAVAQAMAQSAVGLCLSAVEGCMRASMEYLLCGLPVVSTRSIGGRDRYLMGSYSAIVDDDPDAVAAAVARLAGQNFDRLRVRAAVGQLVAFDRHTFRLAINRIAKQRFGIDELFADVSAFIGSLARMEHSTAIRAMVAEKLGPVQPALPNTVQGRPPGRRRADPHLSEALAVDAAGGQPAHPFLFILAKARSGTNFLRSVLAEESWISGAGEPFNNGTVKHLTHHFAHFLSTRISGDGTFDMSSELAEGLLRQYWAYLAEKAGSDRLVLVDIKDANLRIVDWPSHGLLDRPTLLSAVIATRQPVLRIRRRNALAQIASLDRARETLNWVRFADRPKHPNPQVSVRIDPTSLIQRIEGLQRDEETMEAWLGAYQPRATLWYEDLVGGDNALSAPARETISALIGRELTPGVRARTERISPGLRQLIANYGEVAEALTGTPHEAYLT